MLDDEEALADGQVTAQWQHGNLDAHVSVTAVNPDELLTAAGVVEEVPAAVGARHGGEVPQE
ncbi:hypothetical protein [Streptomyces sp. NPDC055912]|uniref:hypothetical protein n=1 Tax=unclassified Streptomyces TaxID=2593676 RepID=UPI0035E16BC6